MDKKQSGRAAWPAVPQQVAGKIKALAGLRGFGPPPAPAAPQPGAPPPQPRATKPGTERWPVKTGVDDDVDRVGKNEAAGAGNEGVVDTTVEELIQIPRPEGMTDIHGFQEDFQSRRAVPVETTIWRLEAEIIAIKKEADGDFHLVLQGASGHTMVAEAPTPQPPFVAAASPFLAEMKEVRRRIADQFGPAFAGVPFQPLNAKLAMPARPVGPIPSAPVAPPVGAVDLFEAAPPFAASVPKTKVTVTGVGFFDRVHDQLGVAMLNGIELHPILEIEFT